MLHPKLEPERLEPFVERRAEEIETFVRGRARYRSRLEVLGDGREVHLLEVLDDVALSEKLAEACPEVFLRVSWRVPGCQ